MYVSYITHWILRNACFPQQPYRAASLYISWPTITWLWGRERCYMHAVNSLHVCCFFVSSCDLYACHLHVTFLILAWCIFAPKPLHVTPSLSTLPTLPTTVLHVFSCNLYLSCDPSLQQLIMSHRVTSPYFHDIMSLSCACGYLTSPSCDITTPSCDITSPSCDITSPFMWHHVHLHVTSCPPSCDIMSTLCVIFLMHHHNSTMCCHNHLMHLAFPRCSQTTGMSRPVRTLPPVPCLTCPPSSMDHQKRKKKTKKQG